MLAAGSAYAQQQAAAAGTTLKDHSGWSASLFVPPVERRNYTDDPSMRAPVPSVVNAAIGRRVAKNTSLGLDVFNVFDRKLGPTDYMATPEPWKSSGPSDNYLFGPTDPRGFRLRLRFTF